jgi:hypothetical protein
VLVCTLLVHLVLAMGMAANHELHEWVHGDAGHDDHECVVQLLLHGGCDNAAAEQPALFLSHLLHESVPQAPVADVPSVFLTGGILEHAPPGGA